MSDHPQLNNRSLNKRNNKTLAFPREEVSLKSILLQYSHHIISHYRLLSIHSGARKYSSQVINFRLNPMMTEKEYMPQGRETSESFLREKYKPLDDLCLLWDFE